MNKISVIIPVYNSEKYLKKCIDSVINQTYNNLEILLIDDGSTDSSSKICDDYSISDKRIKVIHKKNSGTSSARNTGLDNSTGDFIEFIDSDDYVKNDIFEYLLKNMIKYQTDISYFSPHIYVNEEHKPINDAWVEKEEKITIFPDNQNIISSFLEQKITGGVCDKLFKKELFSDIRFPENRLCEDLDVVYRILAKSKKIVGSNISKYYYLCRKTSQNGGSDSGFDKQINSILLVIDDLTKDYIGKYPKLEKKIIYYALDQILIMYVTLINRGTHKHLIAEFENIIHNYINLVKDISPNDRSKKIDIKIFLYKINKHLFVFMSNIFRKIRDLKIKMFILLR